MDEKQVKIEMICDKGRVAEALRLLANAVEADDEKTRQFETPICCAELSEED